MLKLYRTRISVDYVADIAATSDDAALDEALSRIHVGNGEVTEQVIESEETIEL